MTKLCLRAAALVLAAFAIASCGGAAPMEAPKSPAAQDLSSPEAALAALDLAERDLARALGGPAPSAYAMGQSSASSTPAAPPGPPPPPAPVAQARAPEAPRAEPAQPASASVPRDRDVRLAEREAPKAAPPDPCSTACSALASMERATDHLCGLAGAADGRCTSARDRVKTATARVHAACPACAR
ncbi:MAG: hypothetical protein QM820_02730 [Minicystis sp.]